MCSLKTELDCNHRKLEILVNCLNLRIPRVDKRRARIPGLKWLLAREKGRKVTWKWSPFGTLFLIFKEGTLACCSFICRPTDLDFLMYPFFFRFDSIGTSKKSHRAPEKRKRRGRNQVWSGCPRRYGPTLFVLTLDSARRRPEFVGGHVANLSYPANRQVEWCILSRLRERKESPSLRESTW